MANINKITVNGTAYDIEDEKAQSKLNDVLCVDKESASGKVIVINDAIPDIAPVSLPSDATVFGRNMYKINAMDRVTNGITFTMSDDDNTLNVNGTATSNAYSYGSITTANAENLLDEGDYYIYIYSQSGNVRCYYNIISYSTSQSLATGAYESGVLNKLSLSEKCYVALRMQVPSGITVNNEDASIYFSKVPSLDYYPYEAPDGNMHEKTVVLCENSTDYVVYKSFIIDDKMESSEMFPFNLKVATFNCGDYSGNGGSGSYVNEPAGNLTTYAKYIQSLDADILFTQEDREYWNVTNETTMRSVLYDYLYENGGVVSKALSSGNTIAKGIYSNLDLKSNGKYTFTNQGTTTDGGSSYQWSSLSYYYLNLFNKEVLLISVHLASKRWNESVREAQIQEMLSLIEDIGIEYVIIGGDFNVWNDELDVLTNNGYVLANSGLFGDITTFYTNEHPFDNIVVTPNIKIRNVQAHTDNTFNDHYALTATLTIL